MDVRIGYDIRFEVPAPTPVIALIYVHPELRRRLLNPEKLVIQPDVKVEEFLDAFGNRAARFVAPAGMLKLFYDNVIVVPDEPEPVFPDAPQHAIEELPIETLPFLLPSRYCEVDLLMDTAWRLFGQTEPGWARVQAISDWVHNHVDFNYLHARSTKTAAEVYRDGKGVCRDFMHLAITFCRCMNIPARYATGYLGDIRVQTTTGPMDFSAFFEAYLGGRWHPFDARHNARRYGRTLMARGRDAADTALTTSFANLPLNEFVVWTKEQR